ANEDVDVAHNATTVVSGAKDAAQHEVTMLNGANAHLRRARKRGLHGAKTRNTKGVHFNTEVYMFSMFENGHDLEIVHSNDESKEDESIQPTVVDAYNTELIYLGELGEALPLRTDPNWLPTRQAVKQLSIGGIPYKLTFMRRQDLATPQNKPIQDQTHAWRYPRLCRRYLVTEYDVRAFECTLYDESMYCMWHRVKAYETYIDDRKFLFPNLRF
ncbi:hypothetical protein DYB32_008236, partial [Aphanomyces invadans]